MPSSGQTYSPREIPFDERISETVSLSRILDHFLDERESPATVIGFLEANLERIDDIMTFSDHSPRLFSLDLLSRCARHETERFHEIVKSVEDVSETKCLVYQVFCCERSPEWVRDLFRGDMKRLQSLKIPHPYNGRIGETLSKLERMYCFWGTTPYDISEILNRMPIYEYYSLSKHMNPDFGNASWCSSIFGSRILQDDLFHLLSADRQFLYLKGMDETSITPSFQQLKGMKQMLTNRVYPVEMRLHVAKLVENVAMNAYVERILGNIYPDEKILMAKSMNELAMKLHIQGDGRLFDWFFFWVLSIRGFDFVSKCGRNVKSMLEEYYDITDLF